MTTQKTVRPVSVTITVSARIETVTTERGELLYAVSEVYDNPVPTKTVPVACEPLRPVSTPKHPNYTRLSTKEVCY